MPTRYCKWLLSLWLYMAERLWPRPWWMKTSGSGDRRMDQVTKPPPLMSIVPGAWSLTSLSLVPFPGTLPPYLSLFPFLVHFLLTSPCSRYWYSPTFSLPLVLLQSNSSFSLLPAGRLPDSILLFLFLNSLPASGLSSPLLPFFLQFDTVPFSRFLRQPSLRHTPLIIPLGSLTFTISFPASLAQRIPCNFSFPNSRHSRR